MAWDDLVRTPQIEPSLYAADFARLGEQVSELLDAGARVFHFDVGDGHFVEPVTIGPVVLESIAPMIHERGGVLDCHLMVLRPERQIPLIAEAGGDGVTFHVEAVDDPGATARLARSLGLGVGIAFNPGTPVGEAARAAGDADLCLCMSIEPGYSGQAFMPEALGRIAELRALLPEEIPVQVDGGITAANVRAVRDAGASLIVAGSSIFRRGDDLAGAYDGLVRAIA